MRKTRQVARMALGGAVCGGFLGIPLGAALGLALGLLWGSVSWGLDGAVLGILLLSGAGAVVGAFLGVTADERSLSLAEDVGLHPSAEGGPPAPRWGIFHRRG